MSYYKRVAAGVRADFLAGHSLGEVNALLAAECFEFEAGLRLVRKRGEVMSRVSNGAMAAIGNTTKLEIERTLRANGLNNLDLANYNTPSQIVISGLVDEIARAQPLFDQGTTLYYPLNTSGAFHSRFMQAAQEEFRQFLADFTLAEPKIPVIANVTARPYKGGEMQDTLASQMSRTVRWSESMQYLMAIGAARGTTMQFEEVGHGDVLTRLWQTIQRQTPASVLQTIIEDGQADELLRKPDEAPAARMQTPESAPSARVDAATKVTNWNSRHPVGTRVRSLIADYAELETRTQAIVLFGHRAAVYMNGYNGYFDLDELTPV